MGSRIRSLLQSPSPSEMEAKQKQADAENNKPSEYENYVLNERARANSLKERGLMHENQKTVLSEDDWMKYRDQGPTAEENMAAHNEAEGKNRKRAQEFESQNGMTQSEYQLNPRQRYEMKDGEFVLDENGNKKVVLDGDGKPVNNFTNNARNARTQYMNRMATKYRRELADGSVSLDDIMASYDEGAGAYSANEYTNPHTAGVQGARNLTDTLDARQQAQRQLNVDANWDQINQGRMHGVPRGFIAAQQEINNAMASGDPARAAAVSATYARMYGPEFIQFTHSTNQRLGREAEARAEVEARRKPPEPTPMEQWAKDNRSIAMMEPGARLAAMRAQASMGGGDPDTINAQVTAMYQPLAQRLVSTKQPEEWTPEERSEFMQMTQESHMYDAHIARHITTNAAIYSNKYLSLLMELTE